MLSCTQHCWRCTCSFMLSYLDTDLLQGGSSGSPVPAAPLLRDSELLILAAAKSTFILHLKTDIKFANGFSVSCL